MRELQRKLDTTHRAEPLAVWSVGGFWARDDVHRLAVMPAAPAVRPAVAHVAGSWRLLYFDAPNRGEQVRLLFHVANVPFHDVRCTPYPQGLDPYKTAALGDASPLLGTDRCPAVTAPDGAHCVETSEIMRFVGQRVGLAPPAGSVDDLTAIAMCRLAQEVIDGVFYALLKRACVRHIARQELFGLLRRALPRLMLGRERDALVEPTRVLRHALATLETQIADSGGPFVLGPELCYADVSFFDALDKAFMYDFAFDKSALLREHPKVAAWHALTEERARAWLELRVSKHMCGHTTIAGYLAAANTPFFWSRIECAKETTDELMTSSDER